MSEMASQQILRIGGYLNKKINPQLQFGTFAHNTV